MLRSGTSVGANTRSAFRGRSNKEFIAKVGIVIEEADECVYWLELIQETIEHDSTTIQSLTKKADEAGSHLCFNQQKNKI